MKLTNIISRLFFSNTRWRWAPTRSRVLIYDSNNIEFLYPLVSQVKFEVLYLRGEMWFIWPLVQAAVRTLFSGGSALSNYSYYAIKAAHPELVISTVDENPEFWKIKSKFPEVTTLLLQNGRRCAIGDIFSEIQPDKRFFVDYLCTFNDHIASHYDQIIRGSKVSLGSLKSNSIPIFPGNHNQRNLAFISVYEDPPGNARAMRVLANRREVPWGEFFELERWLLPLLETWCTENYFKLQVLGRSNGTSSHEKEFFENILHGRSNWEFVPKTNMTSSYRAVDEAAMVVNTDSTLGYEALARGSKVAFFTRRLQDVQENISLEFGWPLRTEQHGFFWSNERDVDEVSSLLNRLSNASPDKWKDATTQIVHQVMAVDPANAGLKKLLDKILREERS